MCTSIVVNRKKTLIGWNLDLLDMTYRVRPEKSGVYIEILDETEIQISDGQMQIDGIIIKTVFNSYHRGSWSQALFPCQ